MLRVYWQSLCKEFDIDGMNICGLLSQSQIVGKDCFYDGFWNLWFLQTLYPAEICYMKSGVT